MTSAGPETYEHLNRLLAASPSIVYVLKVEDDSLTPVWISGNVTPLLGYSVEEALQPDWWASHLHPDDRSRAQADFVELFETDRLKHEYRFLRKDGSMVWVSVRLQLIRDEEGAPAEVVGAWIDITERKKAEAQATDRLQTLTELYAGAQKLAESLDPEEVALQTVRTCVEVFGASLAWLGRAEPDGRVQPLTIWPPDSDYVRSITVRWDDSPLGQGPTGQAIRGGTAVVCQDVSDDSSFISWRDAAQARGFRTSAAVPLVSRGHTFGALNLYSDHPGFFTPERLEMFQAFAHQAAAALENARAYRNAQQRLQRLEALRDIDRAIIARRSLHDVLQVVVGHIPEKLGADAAAVSLLNGERSRPQVFVMRLPNGTIIEEQAFDLSEELLDALVNRQEPVIIADLSQDPRMHLRREHIRQHQLVSYLAVPLVTHQAVIGIFHILTTRPQQFAAEEVEFFQTLAGQAAIAIENARLVEKLAASEEKYRRLLENSPDVIFYDRLSPHHATEYISPASTEVLGYTPEEFYANPDLLFKLVLPEDHHLLEAALSGQPSVFRATNTLRIRRKDGTVRWVSGRITPIRDEVGNVIAIEGIVRDITERIMAIETFRAILEAAPEAMVVVDERGRIVRINRQTETLFGYSRQELLGQPVEILLPERFRAGHVEQRTAYIAAPQLRPMGIGRELYGRRRDGREFPIEVSLSPVTTPEGQLVASAMRDLTEQRQMEEALQQRVTLLDLLNHITRAISARLDLESIFRVVLGRLEDAELVDMGGAALYDPQSDALMVYAFTTRSAALIDEVGIRKGTILMVDKIGLRPCIDGAVMYVPDLGQADAPLFREIARHGLRSMLALPLRPEEEALGVMVVFRRDRDGYTPLEQEFLQQVSEHTALAAYQTRLYEELETAYEELRQTRQAVLQEERLRALGQMASGIAHDINNALSPIIGFSDLLLMREHGLSDDGKRYLQHIKTGGDDIAHIVARMREFYRKREEQEHLLPVKLDRIVEQVIELTRPRWRDIPQQYGTTITVETDLDSDLPPVLGIESELREALTNLVGNAVDAMPQGGTITIRTCLLGDYIALEVIDTGQGMDEETRLRALEPFYTTKGSQGTGLGLAMVFGVIERHEGKIEIDSEPGRGTTARLLFPVRIFAAQVPEEDEMSEPVASLRVLYIDDDPMLRELLRDMLVGEGHTVTVADGGQEGLNAFREARAQDEPFDLVITDLGMPFIDGRRVARTIKHESPNTPVILLTGWGARLRAEGNTPPAVDVVLNKPPRLHELRRAIGKVVGQRGDEPRPE